MKTDKVSPIAELVSRVTDCQSVYIKTEPAELSTKPLCHVSPPALPVGFEIEILYKKVFVVSSLI